MLSLFDRSSVSPPLKTFRARSAVSCLSCGLDLCNAKAKATASWGNASLRRSSSSEERCVASLGQSFSLIGAVGARINCNLRGDLRRDFASYTEGASRLAKLIRAAP